MLQRICADVPPSLIMFDRFDRGFNRRKVFTEILSQGHHLLCRAKSNAAFYQIPVLPKKPKPGRPHSTDPPVCSCTIITCPPNSMLERIHHRRPVILPQDAYLQWLRPDEQSPQTLQPLLKPYQEQEMETYAVSTFVNRPANDSPKCIAPL